MRAILYSVGFGGIVFVMLYMVAGALTELELVQNKDIPLRIFELVILYTGYYCIGYIWKMAHDLDVKVEVTPAMEESFNTWANQAPSTEIPDAEVSQPTRDVYAEFVAITKLITKMEKPDYDNFSWKEFCDLTDKKAELYDQLDADDQYKVDLMAGESWKN